MRREAFDMASFLDRYEAFIGNGEVNEHGETLDEFLEKYDPYKYKNPCVTVDIIVLKEDSTVKNYGCKVLMIQRKNHPCIGMWALPGGFAEIHEDLVDSAKRELLEETGLKDIPMEQLYTWGEEKRDPRARIITVSYLAYLREDVKIEAGDDAKDAAWMDVSLSLAKTEVKTCNNSSRRYRTYKLLVTHEERQLELSAEVEVGENLDTILKEREYRVVGNEGIAFDHARLIVQALLTLEK